MPDGAIASPNGRPCKWARIVVAAAVLAVPWSGAPAQELEMSGSPWTANHWTPWNDNGMGAEAAPSPHWEGATLVTEEREGLTVWCAAARKAIGYEFTFDPAQLVSDPNKYTVATLSAGGYLFNLPVVHEYEQYQIPNVPNEVRWNGQEEFLRRITASRIIELVSLSDPDAQETVHLSVVMPALGCGAGLERVVNLCGIDRNVEYQFCEKVFCPADTPVLEHFTAAAQSEPDDTFRSPKPDIIASAEEAQAASGDDGVYALAEGLCFGPDGIMRP